MSPDPALFSALLSLCTASADGAILPSYDGGDTGFLNAAFPDWYAWPSQHRLPFAYNAQRTLHWFTHAKQPGYWRAVEGGRVGEEGGWAAYAAVPGGGDTLLASRSWGDVLSAWRPTRAEPRALPTPGLKVLHFSSSPKPWDGACVGRKGPLELLWWEAYLEGKAGGVGWW